MKISDELKTILSLTAAFVLLSLIFKASFFLILAAALLLAGTTSKTLRRIISQGWLRLAHFIGKVNSKLLLLLVFFVVLTPLALLRRVLKQTKKEGDSETNWYTRDHVFKPSDFEKPW